MPTATEKRRETLDKWRYKSTEVLIQAKRDRFCERFWGNDERLLRKLAEEEGFRERDFVELFGVSKTYVCSYLLSFGITPYNGRGAVDRETLEIRRDLVIGVEMWKQTDRFTQLKWAVLKALYPPTGGFPDFGDVAKMFNSSSENIRQIDKAASKRLEKKFGHPRS